MDTQSENTSLKNTLASLTEPGELYHKLPDGKLLCYACGHRCKIGEGKDGICRVRFNRGGILYVPKGYVGALALDPIEKKPFFHAYPGSTALSFGMLGCDFHCGYCFTPDTRIASSKGMLSIRQIVKEKLNVQVSTHTGHFRRVDHFLERKYSGKLFQIKPTFLPGIKATPEHPFLTRLRPDHFPDDAVKFMEAKNLTTNHCLAIPKKYDFSEDVILDVPKYLEPWTKNYRSKYLITEQILRRIIHLTKAGLSSRQIGSEMGKSASHIRHLRCKLKRGEWNLKSLGVHKVLVLQEDGKVRLSKEHAPGIPAQIQLDADLAELFGYYCAEGCVSQSKDRVHSATLSFAFSKKEDDKAQRVQNLLKKVFGVDAYLVNRATTLAVCISKVSLAFFFKSMCGERGTEKKVPSSLFEAKREVLRAFLDAYVAGDGCRMTDGHVRISTISEELAWGVAWIVQKLGYLPQSYRYPNQRKRLLLGRLISQAPWTYLVRWYENGKKQQHVWEDEKFRYIKIRKIEECDYNGFVYNLEVEQEHTYLANGVAVHNCQNWVTSQALRDPNAVSSAQKMMPKEFVRYASETGARVVTSTYNEPLITSEWAVDIFKEAKKAGFVTSYVSNGNCTPEVLDYIRPWVDLYKIDLKSFDDKNYRKLGGVLEHVLEGIRLVYEKGFWLEIVTLIIPGFNDSDEELTRIAEFLSGISPLIPWHVTAFHKDYKMTDPDNTPATTLIRAAEIGKKAGLKYIYPGNLPGRVGQGENTYCHHCGELLIERYGFAIRKYRLNGNRCPQCSGEIPGRFDLKSTS